MKNNSQHTPTFLITHTGLRITPEKVSLTLTTKRGIKKHTELPLEPGIINNGELADPEKFTAVLTQLLKQIPIPDKFVSLGIPEHSSFIRSFKIKPQSNESIADQIPYEIERELPMPLDRIYLDWCFLADSPHTIQTVAIPKQVLDKYLDILNSVGITPLAVETSSLTLGRLIKKVDVATLVIDADTTSTLIVINPDSSINLSAISQSLNPGHLSSDMHQVINDLIAYYRNKYRQEIKQIFYTGPLHEQLTNCLPHSIPAQAIQVTNSVSLSQTMGYSLAQMPIAPPEDTHTINLIPPQIQYHYDLATTHHLKRQLLTISAGFLIFLNLMAALFLGLTLKKTLSAPDSDLNTTKTSGINLLNQITTINQQSAGVLSVVQQKQNFTQILTHLLNLLPLELQINHIRLDSDTQLITVNGFAPEQQQILSLKQKLETSPEFRDVQVPLSILEKDQNIDFVLKFKWNSQVEKE